MAACTPLSAVENLFVPCSANMANRISALMSGGRDTRWIGSTRRLSFPSVRRRRERFTPWILRLPRGLCALHRTAGAAPNDTVCRCNPSHQQTCENPPSHPHRHHIAALRLRLPFSEHHMVAFPREKHVHLLICIRTCNPGLLPPYSSPLPLRITPPATLEGGKCQRRERAPFRPCDSSGMCAPLTSTAARLTAAAQSAGPRVG